MFLYFVIGIALFCVGCLLVKRFAETKSSVPKKKCDTKIEDGLFFHVKPEKRTSRKNVQNPEYCPTLF
jgi:hypothetical protein